MRPTVLGIVIVLALLAAGAIFYGGSAFQAPAPALQSYANDTLGISFTYPAGYVLSENEVGTPDHPHYALTIIREEDAAPRANGEGPTAITLDFYEADASTTLALWLASSASNLALGDGTLASTTVDSTDAARYSWDGLYHGETTAFFHKGNIAAVSVTYMSPADQIRADYEALLASLRLH